MPPCRQCSSSRPVGSSVYKLKPDSPVFLMLVSWLRRHWNSSTVVEASKLTTCGKRIKNVLMIDEIPKFQILKNEIDAQAVTETHTDLHNTRVQAC